MDGQWFLYALLVVLAIVLTLYMGEAIVVLFFSKKNTPANKENDHAEE